LKHPLHADVGDRLKCLFRKVGVDGDLDDAVAITQIKKDHTAMVAAAMHPSGNGHLFIGMGGSDFATGMSFVHCAPPRVYRTLKSPELEYPKSGDFRVR
jgi:hypothetical protein